MDTESLVGRRLGDYLITSFIGRGGMATVHRASDRPGRRDVALKVLRPSAGSEAVEHFAREAVWLSRCADPHIVPVYATGSEDGIQYIAMELLASTLQHSPGAELPGLDRLVAIGASILLGLSAAHRVGIIHGDLKPANVGIARNGVIKLLDFGVAMPLPSPVAPVESATHSEPLKCVGTLHYLPPEQLRGDTIDERADVYGTGAVLYEASTGRPPFPGTRVACLVDAILNLTPPAPSLINPRLSTAFDDVVLKALAKLPASRFRSASVMMDALLAVNEDESPACAFDCRGAAVERRESFRVADGLRVSSDTIRRGRDDRRGPNRTARSGIDAVAVAPRAVGG